MYIRYFSDRIHRPRPAFTQYRSSPLLVSAGTIALIALWRFCVLFAVRALNSFDFPLFSLLFRNAQRGEKAPIPGKD